MARKSIDELGALQKAVMEAVWELGEATVGQVRDRLEREPRAGVHDDPLGDAEAGEGRLADASRPGAELRLSAHAQPRPGRHDHAPDIHRPRFPGRSALALSSTCWRMKS